MVQRIGELEQAIAKKMQQIGMSLNKKLNRSRPGQSLVEMAISAPLLILMFLGVFEVGWALRGYLVLSNANRESARFAVKSQVLDFSEKDPAKVGYNEVLTHTTVSISKQLPIEFLGPEPNATIIMSHFVVDTGFPCVKYAGGNPVLPYEFDSANCDCTNGDPSDPDGDGTPWFSRDDLVLHPDTPGYSYYTQTYGITQTTRIRSGDYQTEADRLVAENNQLNCAVLKTGSIAEISVNNLFVVETMYDQPQLLGAPIISNPLTDPIPFYTHTAMRITVGRDTASAPETIGPTCELRPLTFPKQLFDDLGMDPDAPMENTPIQLKEAGSGNDDFNWVAWNPAQSGSSRYLLESMENPRLVIHDFTDASDAGDNILSLGDKITVAGNPDSTVDSAFTGMRNETIQVPVYDKTTGQVDHIAVLNVTSAITGPRQISALFLNYRDEACEE